MKPFSGVLEVEMINEFIIEVCDIELAMFLCCYNILHGYKEQKLSV